MSLKDNISEKNEYVQHIKNNIMEADLVVWDEVGVKAVTQFEHEHLLNLINLRLLEGKSNIYTSNLSGGELYQMLGDRLYSRIVVASESVVFSSFDKRHLNIG